MMKKPIPYLRVIATTRCPLKCPYCHGEGEKRALGKPAELSSDEIVELISAGLALGTKKLKLLGGEPFTRKDLSEIIGSVRSMDHDVDISIITSGVVPVSLLDKCFDAGLSRCNMSMHGFTWKEFARRGGTKKMFEMRQGFMDRLFDHGKPVKVNYVYTGPEVEPDLAELLSWAHDKPLVVNVLDDLSDPNLDHRVLAAVLRRLRGREKHSLTQEDPYSLPTLHLCWNDGLEIEIKHVQLREVAPWKSCSTCKSKDTCTEGIVALRINHEGDLRLCMDRPDLSLSLIDVLRREGPSGVKLAWKEFLEREAA